MRYPTITFDGSMSIGVSFNEETDHPALTLSKLSHKYEVGQDVSGEPSKPMVALEFVSVKSIKNMITRLEYIKDIQTGSLCNFENLFQYDCVCVEA